MKTKTQKKVLLIGCGMQAYGAALDLVLFHAQFCPLLELILADVRLDSAQRLKQFLEKHKPECSVRVIQCDLSNLGKPGQNELKNSLNECDLILNTAPYQFAVVLTEFAIQAKIPLVDLGGDTNQVLAQLKLSQSAAAANILIIPDCGMGPGMTNITVGHAMEILDTAESVITIDGGIPVQPQPPLGYHLVFAIETLVNEYTGMTNAIRDGKIIEIEPLADIQEVELPVVGKVEATHGMGMLSTLPWTYEKRIKNLDNKFIRYPGHLSFIKTLKALGFFEDQNRVFTKSVLEKALMPKGGERDLSIIQTTSIGMRGKDRLKIQHFILDYSDPKTGLSSMQRTTGFTASIVAQMILAGEIQKVGVLPPELAVPKERFFEEIQKRGFQYRFSQESC